MVTQPRTAMMMMTVTLILPPKAARIDHSSVSTSVQIFYMYTLGQDS